MDDKKTKSVNSEDEKEVLELFNQIKKADNPFKEIARILVSQKSKSE